MSLIKDRDKQCQISNINYRINVVISLDMMKSKFYNFRLQLIESESRFVIRVIQK